MEEEITTTYCICYDFLRAIGYKEQPQSQMNTAEILTTALVAAYYFGGNHETSRIFLQEHRYILRMLSKSQFNRRLHQIPEELWRCIFGILAQIAHASNPTKTYLIDSFPVPVCQNIRIQRCRIYPEERFRGRQVSKKVYFFGLKVHLLVSESGIPVEIFLSAGSYSDTSTLYDFEFNLPKGSYIYGDKAYNVYEVEDELTQRDIHLMPIRKKKSHRGYEFPIEQGIRYVRKKIESYFSVIQQRFPKHIHAVTAKGFELKTILFVLAYAFQTAFC